MDNWQLNKLVEFYLLRMEVDKASGEKPTKKQLEAMLCIIKEGSYVNAAKKLGISIESVKSRMQWLRRRCPQIHKSFRFERFKHWRKKKIINCECGSRIGFGDCYKCWRVRQRKKYPNLYKKDPMFPANGKTISKLSFGGEHWYRGEVIMSCYTE